MPKKKVLAFGELLLRISPASHEDAAGKHPMLLYMGGAELNVATALAGWNVPVKYCTVLPDNFMSRHVINYLEYKGIYTSSIVFAGNRIGIYYLERGADLKGSVIYDRDHSSFSEVKPGTIDWDKVLHDVDFFDFSAISPALNKNVADVCREAVEAAAAKGITICVDLNYRSRLWKYGVQPIEIMPQLVAHSDVIMGNIWAANTLLGIPVDAEIHKEGKREAYLAHAKSTSLQIMKQYPKAKVVANTFRFDSKENEILYYTSLYMNGQQYNSPDWTCKGVKDRSGSGDCFMAGLIYGLYNQHQPQQMLEYATAAAFGKLQEAGDSTDQEVFNINRTANEITENN